MNAFSVDKAALGEILRIFRQSNFRDPVAKLYEKADAGHLFDELKADFLKGTKTSEDLTAIGKKRFEEVADQLKSSLMIGIYERDRFPAGRFA